MWIRTNLLRLRDDRSDFIGGKKIMIICNEASDGGGRRHCFFIYLMTAGVHSRRSFGMLISLFFSSSFFFCVWIDVMVLFLALLGYQNNDMLVSSVDASNYTRQCKHINEPPGPFLIKSAPASLAFQLQSAIKKYKQERYCVLLRGHANACHHLETTD